MGACLAAVADCSGIECGIPGDVAVESAGSAGYSRGGSSKRWTRPVGEGDNRAATSVLRLQVGGLDEKEKNIDEVVVRYR